MEILTFVLNAIKDKTKAAEQEVRADLESALKDPKSEASFKKFSKYCTAAGWVCRLTGKMCFHADGICYLKKAVVRQMER